MSIFSRLILITILLAMLPVSFACNKKADDQFNPKVPLIQSIALARGGVALTDATVYYGEQIAINVTAQSQSVLGDCYTPGQITTFEPDLTTPTELQYVFTILPPAESTRLGELTQDIPPGNIAQWRVPKVSDVPGFQDGLNYTIRVSAIDDCVNLTTIGEVNVMVFSDKGPPSISSLDVTSRRNGAGTWGLEELDANNLFEVEPADGIRIRSTATSHSDSSLCLGLGITPAKSLHYLWDTVDPSIEITTDADPVLSKDAFFDVPDIYNAGDTFAVSLTIIDTCSEAQTVRWFNFVVIEPPIITLTSVQDDSVPIQFNVYSGYYEVEPGGFDEIVVNAENADSGICASKGFIKTRSYAWTETTGATPKPQLVFESIPDQNFRSRLTFIVPGAVNGTKYTFHLEVTDRCNGLKTTADYPFMVVVPPSMGATTILEDGTPASYNQITGHYEISSGSTITITQPVTTNSTSSFCTGRGVPFATSLEYDWTDKLNYYNFVYDKVPDPNESSTIYFIIPTAPVGFKDTVTVAVKDLCNDLSSEKSFIFEIVG